MVRAFFGIDLLAIFFAALSVVFRLFGFALLDGFGRFAAANTRTLPTTKQAQT